MSGKLRLLICHDCTSIEELPDYHGDPRDDHLLEHLVQAHRFPNGEEHIGALADVERDQWENPEIRKAIIERIGQYRKPGEGGGVGAEFYATKDTFREDAIKCFNQHGRPKGGCIDYKDDRKRLGNPTKEGWQQGAKIYLCDFCPVKTYVTTEIRHKRGAYRDG